mmetsp:Transcript_2700/g.7373  ORF Transcript_2700/g.7373 Transcript_2700/m.7373 type:complete len:294 (-) Transcript_2700:101-982(-)
MRDKHTILLSISRCEMHLSRLYHCDSRIKTEVVGLAVHSDEVALLQHVVKEEQFPVRGVDNGLYVCLKRGRVRLRCDAAGAFDTLENVLKIGVYFVRRERDKTVQAAAFGHERGRIASCSPALDHLHLSGAFFGAFVAQQLRLKQIDAALALKADAENLVPQMDARGVKLIPRVLHVNAVRVLRRAQMIGPLIGGETHATLLAAPQLSQLRTERHMRLIHDHPALLPQCGQLALHSLELVAFAHVLVHRRRRRRRLRRCRLHRCMHRPHAQSQEPADARRPFRTLSVAALARR